MNLPPPDLRPQHVQDRERRWRTDAGIAVWALMVFIAIGIALAPRVAVNARVDAALVHTHGLEAAAYALGR